MCDVLVELGMEAGAFLDWLKIWLAFMLLEG